jgi:hypothetical protein
MVADDLCARYVREHLTWAGAISAKPSIPLHVFSIQPTVWGICSSLEGQPDGCFRWAFDRLQKQASWVR